MNKTIKSIPSYIFWLTWSIITGGMIIIGPVLAPIAFTTMPVTVSPEIAQYAYSYAGTLFTLSLYPIFSNSSRALSADHYFGTFLYL